MGRKTWFEIDAELIPVNFRFCSAWRIFQKISCRLKLFSYPSELLLIWIFIESYRNWACSSVFQQIILIFAVFGYCSPTQCARLRMYFSFKVLEYWKMFVYTPDTENILSIDAILFAPKCLKHFFKNPKNFFVHKYYFSVFAAVFFLFNKKTNGLIFSWHPWSSQIR